MFNVMLFTENPTKIGQNGFELQLIKNFKFPAK